MKFGGEKPEGIIDFVEKVKSTPPGTKVNIEIEREGEIKVIEIEIGKREREFYHNIRELINKELKKWLETENIKIE